MQAVSSFDIVLKRKVPIILSFLFGLLIFFGFYSFLFFLFLLFIQAVTYEIKVAFFILAVPDFVQTSVVISFVGFILTLFLYFSARLTKKACLVFQEDQIAISGSKINIFLPKHSISKIFCNDLKDAAGKPKE